MDGVKFIVWYEISWTQDECFLACAEVKGK